MEVGSSNTCSRFSPTTFSASTSMGPAKVGSAATTGSQIASKTIYFTLFTGWDFKKRRT